MRWSSIATKSLRPFSSQGALGAGGRHRSRRLLHDRCDRDGGQARVLRPSIMDRSSLCESGPRAIKSPSPLCSSADPGKRNGRLFGSAEEWREA